MKKLRIMLFLLLYMDTFVFSNTMKILWYPQIIHNISDKNIENDGKPICIYDGKTLTQLEAKINDSYNTKDEIYKEVLPEGYYEIIIEDKDEKRVYKIINSKNMIYENDYYVITFFSDIRNILLKFITEKYLSGELSFTPTNCDL